MGDGVELTYSIMCNCTTNCLIFLPFSVPSSNASQQQDPNRPPPGAAVPPGASGTDMQGPSTPLQGGGGAQSCDGSLNASKFTGIYLFTNDLLACIMSN